jgi:Tol biopolymer transport system component
MHPIKKLLCFVLLWMVSSGCSPSHLPTVPALPSTTPEPVQAASPASFTPDFSPQIQPVSGLSGKLILIASGANGNTLIRYDLARSVSTVLFQAPAQSWLAGETTSPDGTQILLAYAPPPPAGKSNYGYTDLYLLPTDGSAQPSPYLKRASETESLFDPSWAPDGKSIYYARFFYTDPKAGTYTYQIEQVTADKKVAILVKQAFWPRPSPDGKKLAYLSFDPVSKNNELYMADAEGQNPVPLLPKGSFPEVDSLLFSPDGSTITFSAVNTQPNSNLNWWDRLTGVISASAHDIPSDWYRVSVEGGQPSRLTKLNDTGLYGQYSPDGNHIAFICSTGLYIMDEDGSHVNQISNATWLGTLDWIP